MGQLGRFIDEYKDRQKYRPTSADIAKELGVAKTTVGNWYAGAMPRPEHLRALSRLIDVPYTRLLDAALGDQGYLATERGGHGGDTAAKTVGVGRALPSTPHEWDVASAALLAAGLDEKKVPGFIGERPTPPPRRGGGSAIARRDVSMG